MISVSLPSYSATRMPGWPARSRRSHPGSNRTAALCTTPTRSGPASALGDAVQAASRSTAASAARASASAAVPAVVKVAPSRPRSSSGTPQGPLQQRDGLANGGLRHAKVVGGGGKAALLGNSPKAPELHQADIRKHDGSPLQGLIGPMLAHPIFAGKLLAAGGKSDTS